LPCRCVLSRSSKDAFHLHASLDPRLYARYTTTRRPCQGKIQKKKWGLQRDPGCPIALKKKANTDALSNE
jgi:hypothetical protein